MEVGRRGFVLGAVAAACAACAGCSDDGVRPDAPAGPDPVVGFGSSVDVGPLDDVVASIAAGGGFRYVPEARAHLVTFPEQALDDARAVYDDATVAGMEHGLVALHQKCTHLGCRVPECLTSGRFECQCHGAIFNHIGEYVAGPAPRGLDRFAVTVEGGRVMIDTSVPLEGAPIGTRTIDDAPDGVPCIPLDG